MIRRLVKKITSVLDNRSKANLSRKVTKLEGAWYNSAFLKVIRRSVSSAIIQFKLRLGITNNSPLRLHLGCGDRHLEGYVNIDWRKTKATDLVCDIRDLPYGDNSVELIESYHVIEHLPRHDLPKALKEWYRILIPGRELIVECPDFDEIVRRYLEGDERQLDGMFGLQRWEGDFHYFGYSFKRLERLLEEWGFIEIRKERARDYHTKEWPCLRVECMKQKATQERHFIREKSMKFTGERVVEGNTPERIWLDHVARYRFATAFVKGKTVLDVACGTGYGSAILSREGKASHVIGIDISREAIEYAIQHYASPDVEFKVGDAHNIQLPAAAVDIVVSFETIEHLNDYQNYLEQIYRVLKENGLFIVSSPNRHVTSPGKSLRDKPNNEFHTVEFTKSEFKALLARFKFKGVKFFGQRAIHKLLSLSPVRKVLGKVKNDYYLIADGNPEVRDIPLLYEPRYYVAICWKEA